jgi:hypothetical protein
MEITLYCKHLLPKVAPPDDGSVILNYVFDTFGLEVHIRNVSVLYEKQGETQ